MSIIIEKPPEGMTSSADGNWYPLNTDFRVWIKFEALFEELKQKSEEAVVEACILCFKREDGEEYRLPETALEAIRMLFAFYCGMKDMSELEAKKKDETEDEEADEEAEDNKQRQIYSYEHDGDYIYAAFVQQYGIDLTECNLHWWKFKALFAGLTSATKMREIMEIRATDVSKIKDKERRAHIIRLQDIYSLPDMRSEEEKENDFAAAFW